mgnify:CR=1 FL=1
MPLTDHQELAAESRGGARLVSAAAGSDSFSRPTISAFKTS